MFFYLKISKTSFSLLYTKTWFNNKIFFSLSHKEIPPKIECQEVFLIILSLFENLYWWVLYIHQIFSAYELETFKEVRHDMIIINPLNAKGIYICDHKCMFFTNNHGHIYKPVGYSHYEYLVAAYVKSGIHICPWLLMPKQCGIQRVNSIIYIFLLYAIFHQHLKITFRNFSAPVPWKNPLPPFYSIPP